MRQRRTKLFFTFSLLSLLAIQFYHLLLLTSIISPYQQQSDELTWWNIHNNSNPTTTRTTIPTLHNTPPNPLYSHLPPWISNYLSWHTAIRTHHFPGTSLFTYTSAPNIVVRYCYAVCGGLNDRLGGLLWDLYVANRTERIYVIHWIQGGFSLSEFLVPNLVDWTVLPSSEEDEAYFGGLQRPHLKNMTRLFGGSGFSNEEDNMDFLSNFDESLRKARSDGENGNVKFLGHRLLALTDGMEDELERRVGLCEDFGDCDAAQFSNVTFVSTLDENKKKKRHGDAFAPLFHTFFRPSLAVQARLDETRSFLGLNDNKTLYSAVHCRVRHPRGVAKKEYGKLKTKTGFKIPDVEDLDLNDDHTKSFALGVATRGVRCAKDVLKNKTRDNKQEQEEPIYFMSDSYDLVRHVTEISQTNPKNNKNNQNQSILSQVKILSRPPNPQTKSQTFHIERQMGNDAYYYYDTFVDLYIAMGAQCIVLGVGNYAYLAARISGNTECVYRSEEEVWGDKGNKGRLPLCPAG